MAKLEKLSSDAIKDRECSEEHRERVVVFMEDMRPILEAQHWIIYTQKFLKWMGISFLATLAFIYIFIRRL